MNLLVFTLRSGNNIAINPEHIVAIQNLLDGTMISCVDECIVIVKEPIDQVFSALNAWRKKA